MVESAPYSQGEDVVAGIRTPVDITDLEAESPGKAVQVDIRLTLG